VSDCASACIVVSIAMTRAGRSREHARSDAKSRCEPASRVSSLANIVTLHPTPYAMFARFDPTVHRCAPLHDIASETGTLGFQYQKNQKESKRHFCLGSRHEFKELILNVFRICGGVGVQVRCGGGRRRRVYLRNPTGDSNVWELPTHLRLRNYTTNRIEIFNKR
jgi:hypothetical protein